MGDAQVGAPLAQVGPGAAQVGPAPAVVAGVKRAANQPVNAPPPKVLKVNAQPQGQQRKNRKRASRKASRRSTKKSSRRSVCK